MENLTALLKRFAKRPGCRTWSGPRPTARTSKTAQMIAAQVGYPSPEVEPWGTEGLIEVDARKAAELLAFFRSNSLPYGPYKVRQGLRRQAAEALRDLGDNARFFTNGPWLVGAVGAVGTGGASLSNATCEGGVIGFGDDHAFIYWVEEED